MACDGTGNRINAHFRHGRMTALGDTRRMPQLPRWQRLNLPLTQSTEPRTSTVFPVLESPDLLNWVPRGGALKRLDPAYGSEYWAPEIAFIDGNFWMYYSLGFGDKGHHLRVRLSVDVGGPYIDTGTPLTNPFSCPFAIDPSPFQDDDGSWYLFYARDFLDSNDTRTAPRSAQET